MSQSVANAIDSAVQQSTQQGEAAVPATQNQGGAPATPAAAAPSMDSFLSGAMVVDGYIKVDSYGIHFDDNKRAKKDAVDVIIDTNEVQPTQVVRFGSNPPTYYKTYDGVSCAQGGTWQSALETARMSDPQCKPYQSADIPMSLVESFGEEYEAGTKLGHSLSPTNQKSFSKFWRQVNDEGLMGETVKVRVSWSERSKNGNTWGVLTFELLGEAEE